MTLVADTWRRFAAVVACRLNNLNTESFFRPLVVLLPCGIRMSPNQTQSHPWPAHSQLPYMFQFHRSSPSALGDVIIKGRFTSPRLRWTEPSLNWTRCEHVQNWELSVQFSPVQQTHASTTSLTTPATFPTRIVMAALRSRCGHYIFVHLVSSIFFFYLFPSPILSRRRLDVYHTSTHGVALVRI